MNKSESDHDSDKVILVGTAGAVMQVARQLSLPDLGRRPTIVGALLWREIDDAQRRAMESAGVTILGPAHQIEKFVTRDTVDAVIVSLPAAMTQAVSALRTRVRKLGVADRFFATIEDQLAGVGPRTQIEIDVADLIDRTPYQIDLEAVGRTVRGKVVLITGAGGSIGSELARRCVAFEPAQLVLMERSENALFEIDRQIAGLASSGQDRARGPLDIDRNRARGRAGSLERRALLHDVTDAPRTLALCQEIKPDVIFHSAAHKHVPMMQDHPIEAIANNFFGTVAIADAAAAVGCERFVMISTDKAVNPTSIMGATKRLAELYVQHMNQESACVFRTVRFGNVLASSGSVLPVWADQIRQGGPVTVTHPEMMRYFMTIPEAASLVIQAAALDDGDGSEVMLLDMGEPISILELAKRYIVQHGLVPIVDRENEHREDRHESPGTIPIVFTGIRPGEKLFEDLAYDHESLLKSGHPGIAVWQMERPTANQIEQIMESLTACVSGECSAVEAAQVVRDLVPEMTRPIVTETGVVPTVRSDAARAPASAA